MKEIETSDGRKIRIKEVGRLLGPRIVEGVTKEFIAAGRQISPPAYEAKTAAGTVEIHVHDEKSVTTDEEKATWKKYVEDTEALDKAQNVRLFGAYLYLGIVEWDAHTPVERRALGIETEPMVSTVPQEWVETRRYVGASIPDNERELRTEYIYDALLSSTYDLLNVFAEITKLTNAGVDQEDVQAAEKSFQRAVERHKPKRPRGKG